MRCLVTGASGFLGSHLVRALVARGHEVSVFARPGSNLAVIHDVLGSVRVVWGTLADLRELESALADAPVEAAFHLAWFGVTAEHRNSPEQITGNVVGSLALCELLARSGCGAFIGVGSQAEYGIHTGVLCEDTPTRPVTAYGTAKLAVGLLTRQLCAMHRVRHVWLRLLSAYGPGDDRRHMVPTLIETLLRSDKPSLTAGEQVWDFLYVSDAVAAMIAALESNADGVFNLASGSTCRLREFVEMVRDEIDPALPIGFGEVAYKPDQVMHLEGDISNLRAATGWAPKVDLREGIRRTVQWHKQSAAKGKHVAG